DTNTANWTTALNTLMGQIAANAAGVVIDGSTYSSSTSSFPFPGLVSTAGSTGGPKAYLNWIIFGKSYNYLNGGYMRLSATPKETGQDIAHERLFGTINVTEPGYVYIYLSNEETSPVEVYFDDFKVTQTKTAIIQSSDYYPFGLTFNSFQRENNNVNQYKFNGKEEQEELALNWLDYGARMYDAGIGRWVATDPLAEISRRFSPYAYAYDNPIRFVDPDGMSAKDNLEDHRSWIEGASERSSRRKNGSNSSVDLDEHSSGESKSTSKENSSSANKKGLKNNSASSEEETDEVDPDLSSDAGSWQYVPVGPDGHYQSCAVVGLYYDVLTTWSDGKGVYHVEYERFTYGTLYFEFPRIRIGGKEIIGGREAARLTAAAKDIAEELVEMKFAGKPMPMHSTLEKTFLTQLRSILKPYGARVSTESNYGPVPTMIYKKSIWGNGR
ncbi:MAG: RHS repeat-associated core domain-containing protein, partial [Chryseolinea sp.]